MHFLKALLTIIVQEGRVFPRLFTHGGGGWDLSPPIWGAKALMGRTHEGGYRPYGET